MERMHKDPGVMGSQRDGKAGAVGSLAHRREIEFHDTWASTSHVEDVLVCESFESPLAPENRMALEVIGSLQGKKVLDVACGLGEAAVYFALKGAEVTAVDISSHMVDHTMALAKHHNAVVSATVGSAEALELPDDEFDVCYAANLLHHAQDIRKTLEEMRRVLKPSGLVFTIDPLAYNPVINVYRRMATAVRTPDERPLTFNRVREFKRLFVNVEERVFWLSSLLIFVKYYLVDGVHPNKDRYWKRVLREGPSTLAWLGPLMRLDSTLLRLPFLRYLAWTLVIHGRKPQ
jgi:SAM-dependent methyltransferase